MTDRLLPSRDQSRRRPKLNSIVDMRASISSLSWRLINDETLHTLPWLPPVQPEFLDTRLSTVQRERCSGALQKSSDTHLSRNQKKSCNDIKSIKCLCEYFTFQSCQVSLEQARNIYRCVPWCHSSLSRCPPTDYFHEMDTQIYEKHCNVILPYELRSDPPLTPHSQQRPHPPKSKTKAGMDGEGGKRTMSYLAHSPSPFPWVISLQ